MVADDMGLGKTLQVSDISSYCTSLFVGTEFLSRGGAHEQAGRVRSMELEIRLASTQGLSILRTPPKTCQSI